MIERRNYQAVLSVLEFIIDEEKSQEVNLIDCFSDYSLEVIKREDNQIVFAVGNSNSDEDFDWNLMLTLTPYLEEGSFYEERPPEMEDSEGRTYDGVFVGTVEKGHLIRRCYEL